jgi:hypothetical protein
MRKAGNKERKGFPDFMLSLFTIKCGGAGD